MIKSILLFVLISVISVSAQNFSRYIGKSQSELINALGKPEIKKQNGDQFIYQYRGKEHGERITYGIKNKKIFMAIQSFPGLSFSEAINKKDVIIVTYMTEGYKKQGTQSGMTILKKGDKVLSIGYMDDTGEKYVTLITAYN